MAMPENRFKLRQIALVARHLAPLEEDLTAIFGLGAPFRDPAVARFGLENIVIPIGNQFLEVVAPMKPGTAAERYLERRGGDGGYMVILQCADPKVRNRRVDSLGWRIAHTYGYDDHDGLQLHPKDTGGTFLEVDWAPNFEAEDGPWHPGGADWHASRRTGRVQGIAAAEIQSGDPVALATRWGGLLGTPEGNRIRTESGDIRFVRETDGRGDGLAAIDLFCSDPRAVLDEAQRRDRRSGDMQVLAGGLYFNLIAR